MIPLQLLLCSIPLVLVAVILKRVWRLRSVPGPFLASFTDIWRAYNQNTRSFTVVLAQLHKKYGPMVRVGPNTVSFSDPAVVSTIYTSHGEFKKADSYQPLRAAVNGQIQGSVIDTQDEALVSAIRRTVGGSFATKNIVDYEDEVDEVAALLINRMRHLRKFDLFAMMGQFQADFLLKIAFSEESHFLTTGESSESFSFNDRFIHWMKWQAMPYLEHVLYKPPFLYKYIGSKKIPAWARMANDKLNARLASREDLANKYPDLLTKYITGSEKRGDQLPIEIIPRMVTSTISAGFDTTAFTMTTMIYYLCRTPYAMEKLRAELEGANLSSPPHYRETEPLKYLSAVIKEAMRMFPFLNLILEREVPAGGASIAGKWFPGGTNVGCHPSIVHYDSEFWGKDADHFRPERWLIDDAQKRLAMERASLGFGNGKRICLGRHLAELEIKKVVPLILLNFKMSLVDSNYVLEPRDRLTSFPKPVWVNFETRQ